MVITQSRNNLLLVFVLSQQEIIFEWLEIRIVHNTFWGTIDVVNET